MLLDLRKVISHYVLHFFIAHVINCIVPRSAAFPLGVRVYWRKYSADVAIEIGPDSNEKLVGLSAWEVISKWEPEAERQVNEQGDVVSEKPGGMYLMWKLPTDQLQPAPLLKGSFLQLMEVYTKVKTAWTTLSNINDKTLEDWDEFVKTCPKSDDVEEFIKDNPHQYHIPFKRILFKGEIRNFLIEKFIYLILLR